MSQISKDVGVHIRNTIKDEVLYKEIIQALTTPAKTYFLQLNLSKFSINNENQVSTTEEEPIILQEIIKTLQNIDEEKIINEHAKISPLFNTLQLPVSEPNKLPLEKKRIYCDKFASEAVRVGADLFVPGFTRTPNKFKKGERISIMLDPKKIPPFLTESIPEIFTLPVANGIAKIDSKELPKHTKGILIENTNPTYNTPKYRDSVLYNDGWISEQIFPANLATAILSDLIIDYKKQQSTQVKILDTCSAPGHKTCALAEWLYWKTKTWHEIISIDRSKNRLQHLWDDVERLGLKEIFPTTIRLERIKKQMPELIGNGDFVIFDPPCSALGTRSKLFIEKNMDDLLDYSKNQRRLLKVVDTLVKPGGILMYNTCTIPIEENEQIIEYAKRKLGYIIADIPEKYKQFGSPALPCEGIEEEELDRMRRFYPRRDQGIGFFIAVLQKQTKQT